MCNNLIKLNDWEILDILENAVYRKINLLTYQTMCDNFIRNNELTINISEEINWVLEEIYYKD